MRYFLADTVYAGYVQWLYGQNPGLGNRSYDEQYDATVAGGFHTAGAWAEPLRQAGHTVMDIWADHVPLQVRWCQENNALDLAMRSADAYRFGTTMVDNNKGHPWYLDIVAEQVRRFRPDVMVLANIYAFDSRFLAALRGHFGIAIGQHAAALPQNDLKGYDVIISSLPNQVKHFRALGIRSELVKLAFDARLLGRIERRARRQGLIFSGQVTSHHRRRAEALLALGREMELDIFGDTMWRDEDLAGTKIRRHPALWGLPMYQGLADARIVFNSHLDAAGPYANNLRLFEVTGMGSLLLTDAKQNLAEMFEPGRECIAYDNIADCVRLARYYLDHEDERAAIARAGHARILAQHTYEHRLADLLQIAGGLVPA